MKKVLHIIIILTAVGLISGACLVYMYRYSVPLIKENQKKETEEAVFKVFSQAASFEAVKKGGEEVFLVKDKSGKKIGYAFKAAGNGYQGEIVIMAGISTDLKTLSGIEILESQETPGLGQEITSDPFRKQFNGLTVTPEIIYVKGKKPNQKNEIETITGATISSKAVVSILNDKIKKLKEIL